MNTIIQHSVNLEIATKISTKYDCDFKRYNSHIRFHTDQQIDLDELRQTYQIDFNYLPNSFDFQKVAIFISDMDSTLINIECIDEIADFINLKPQVAAITESAMRGEIDFETSLRQRVSLLKGLDVTVLERVYDERLKLSPGAEVMVSSLKSSGIKLALVSGGFTFFTDRLKQRLNLDFSQANRLAEHDGKLTGEVEGDICGAQTKADFLLDCCEQIGIRPEQTIAVGDGANDLEMLASASLGIAFNAKRYLRERAAGSLSLPNLDALLYFLGISKTEISGLFKQETLL